MTLRLTNPEEDRYQRLRLIRWWNQELLGHASALVVGAGALGNEVVKNLALLGFSKIWIADFDRIETTNLTRSVLFRASDVGQWKAEVLAARAMELNPDCSAVPLRVDVRYELGLAFMKQIDLIFGCLDNREARYFINRSSYLLRKMFIDGGLETLNGSVSVFHPPATPCYECTLSKVDRAELQKRISCLKGPEPEVKQHVPTAPTIASIIGGLQVQIGVRLIHGQPVPSGKRLGLYGLSDVFFDIALEKSDDCGLHAFVDPLPEDIATLEIGADRSLNDVLQTAHEQWGATAISWQFDRDLITGLNCTSCGATRDFVGSPHSYSGNSECDCGGIYKTMVSTEFSGTEHWGSRNFQELGFPPQHIFAAIAPNKTIYFQI
jgi:molybdopterin/thiamine biosynthesis adenylyltransferase